MMRLSQAASVTNGQLSGKDQVFTGVNVDSRKMGFGDLFVAIPGDRYDGHDYVGSADRQGAAGAMVASLQPDNVSQIVVENTTEALGTLSAHWRSRFDIPIIAVTGSTGKTTVTTMIASILRQLGNCLSPRGSFNNQWGVPLTMLGLKPNHRYAVLEMGMNHPGELDYLTSLASPDIALITNVSPAHLEGLGNVRNIAAAKAEIFNGLRKEGVAILNINDPFYSYWHERLGGVAELTFGFSKEASVRVQGLKTEVFGSQFELFVDHRTMLVKLPLAGKHNVMNAAAAAAAGIAAGASLQQIKNGLEATQVIKGRLSPKLGWNGSLVIDDTYNANPASVNAAIEVLASSTKRTVLVLGAMAELGPNAEEFHRQVGKKARQSDIDWLYCLDSTAHDYVKGYCEGYGRAAKVFTQLDPLVASLKSHLNDNTLVMVKGSRSAGMERVVKQIVLDEEEKVIRRC